MFVFIALFAVWATAAAIAIPVRILIAALARDATTIARYGLSIAHGAGLAAWSLYHPYGIALEAGIGILLAAAGIGSAAATVFLRGRARGPSLLILTETLCACLAAYAGAKIVLHPGGAFPGAIGHDVVSMLPNALQIFAGSLPTAFTVFFVLRAITTRWARRGVTPRLRSA